MSPRTWKWSRRSLLLVGLALLGGVWFQQTGYQTLRDLRDSIQQEQELKAEVARLKAENQALDAEIQSLQNDEGWEKLARERLGLAKPGEYVVKIPGKK